MGTHVVLRNRLASSRGILERGIKRGRGVFVSAEGAGAESYAFPDL